MLLTILHSDKENSLMDDWCCENEFIRIFLSIFDAADIGINIINCTRSSLPVQVRHTF
jgi:hypothetical protein